MADFQFMTRTTTVGTTGVHGDSFGCRIVVDDVVGAEHIRNELNAVTAGPWAAL